MSRDYLIYENAGLRDSFESIGSLNLFMVCEELKADAFCSLPQGYSSRLARRDELDAWKHTAVEEPYVKAVADYYENIYAKNEEEFFRRCTFICNSEDKPVATAFIWRSYGKINTLAWLRVLPGEEGKGIGRALLSVILKTAECPVYIHTQPTSVCAVKLYSDFGFKLITNPVVGHRKNNLNESLPYLQKVMTGENYAKLQFTGADSSLHAAALSSEVSEF